MKDDSLTDARPTTHESWCGILQPSNLMAGDGPPRCTCARPATPAEAPRFNVDQFISEWQWNSGSGPDLFHGDYPIRKAALRQFALDLVAAFSGVSAARQDAAWAANVEGEERYLKPAPALTDAFASAQSYMQHKAECEHVKGVRYTHSNDWGEQSYRWDTTGRHTRKPKCTCGLEDVLKKVGGKAEALASAIREVEQLEDLDVRLSHIQETLDMARRISKAAEASALIASADIGITKIRKRVLTILRRAEKEQK